MKKFGIIGYPVSDSKSPLLFDAAYHGKYQYDRIETPDFEEAWSTFVKSYHAVNVTMPFKMQAAARADILAPEVQATGAANILVKTDSGIEAHNSDYLGVKAILTTLKEDMRTAAVIGTGGAGRAAEYAARTCGFQTRTYHHGEIEGGVEADIIIYCLPKAVAGIDRLRCKVLLEANYKDPCLESMPGTGRYIHGSEWLVQQGLEGYLLMSGDEPDRTAVRNALQKTRQDGPLKQ